MCGPRNSIRRYYLFFNILFRFFVWIFVAVTPQRTAREISTRFIVRNWQTVVEMCESTSACIGSRRRLALGSRQRRRRRRWWRQKDRPQTEVSSALTLSGAIFFIILLFYHYNYYYSQLSFALPHSPPPASLRALNTIEKLTCVTRSEFSIVPARNVTQTYCYGKSHIIFIMCYIVFIK